MSTNRLGEEFRDDLRGTAADRATAQQVRRLLPPERLAELTQLDPARSVAAITQTLAIIAVTIGVGWIYFTWWIVIPAVVLIGIQQHALFVLAHDAAHYRLFENRALNDAIGCFVGSIGGVSMMSYRVIHRLHHNHLYGPQDPDIALHGGYPRGKAYLAKKLVKDVAGLTAFKTFAYFFGAPSLNTYTGKAERPLVDTSPRLRKAALRDRWTVLAFHMIAPVVAFATGWGWQYVVLWMLPLATVLQAILRLRAICEHGAVTDFSSPLTAARTNLASLSLRYAMFPHHVN